MTSSGDEERSREAGGGGSSSTGGGTPSPNLEWRFNQTLRNVQGLLKGRSFPGKVLVTRKSETMNESPSPRPPEHERSYADNYFRKGEHKPDSFEREGLGSGGSGSGSNPPIARVPSMNNESASPDTQKSSFGARATDSARVTKFTKEMSKPAVILGCRRAVSGFRKLLIAVRRLSVIFGGVRSGRRVVLLVVVGGRHLG